MSHSEGPLGGGDYRFDSPYLWIKPRTDLYFSASSERVESFGAFEQTTLVAKWDVTPMDAIGARLVVVDGDRYSRLTYGRQARKGMDIFSVIDKTPGQLPKFSVKLLFTYY